MDHSPSKCHTHVIPSSPCGLVTATSAGDIHRSHNVVESSTIKSTTTPATSSTSPSPPPGGIGLFDNVIGGDVDGLMSCTESLGFESSDDMRRVDDDIDGEMELITCCQQRQSSSSSSSTENNKWRKTMTEEKREQVKVFPPPLSSLDENGHPCFFLRPVRKDGRLELSEVRIDRPDILRAHREDGRLKLQLIIPNEDEEEILENDDETINEEDEEEEVELESDQSELLEKVPSPSPSSSELRRRSSLTGEGFGRSRKGKAPPPLLGKQHSTNDYQSLQLGFRFGFDVIRVGLNLMKGLVWWMTSGVDGGLADCYVENDGGYGVLRRNQWCCY
ncbi:hypothetical protein ACFE04_004996 [Oxalis oulophora]